MIEVRRATAADMEAILALIHEQSQAAQWTESQLAPYLQPAPEIVRRICLVAHMENAQLRGFLAGRVLPPEAELENLAVAADAKRQGIARALFRAFAGWAADQQAVLVRLEVRAANHTATATYKELGFTETARRTAYYTNPADDAILMEKRLSPA